MAYEVGPVYFDAPPVAEVALSIQTSPNPRVLGSHMGVFWDRHLRLEYPHAQDQTPAAPTIERFDESSRMPSMVFAMGTPVVRQWYLSADQTRLVQLQNDRLVVNWRRLLDTQEYPHYSVLREEIARLARLWQDFLGAEGLAPQPVVQAEVTYINQVTLEASLSGAGALLRAAVQPQWPPPMGEPESFQLEQRFVVQAPGDKLARMYLALAPAMFDNSTQGLTLNLVVRGEPADTSHAGVLRWMDFAHNQIIHSFADITTEQMHDKWRERNERTSDI